MPGSVMVTASAGAVTCASRPNGFDAFAANEHHPAVVRRVGDRVPDAIGNEQRRRTDRRRRRPASTATLRDDDCRKGERRRERAELSDA